MRVALHRPPGRGPVALHRCAGYAQVAHALPCKVRACAEAPTAVADSELTQICSQSLLKEAGLRTENESSHLAILPDSASCILDIRVQQCCAGRAKWVGCATWPLRVDPGESAASHVPGLLRARRAVGGPQRDQAGNALVGDPGLRSRGVKVEGVREEGPPQPSTRRVAHKVHLQATRSILPSLRETSSLYLQSRACTLLHVRQAAN